MPEEDLTQQGRHDHDGSEPLAPGLALSSIGGDRRIACAEIGYAVHGTSWYLGAMEAKRPQHVRFP